MKHEFVSSAPHETEQAGARIGSAIQPGTVIALRGPLGGGKTCFVQGIARGMGISDQVISPTYTLVIPYSGDKRLLHVDAYRIVDADELAELGLEEELESGAILAIEWYDRFKNDFPPADLIVTLADGNSERERKIRIESCSESGTIAVASIVGLKD